MTIKQFVDLAMFKFCPPKSSIFWWFKKWRKMVFLSMKKKMLDCTHFARQRLFTTETKTIFLPSSSFKFIFYMLQFFNNSTVLQVAKKPIETVLMLQYFKRVWYREINKTTVLQKRETYLVLLTFLLWFKFFPISFALSRSLTASWQPLPRWGQTTPSMCAKRVGSFFQNGAEKVCKGF